MAAINELTVQASDTAGPHPQSGWEFLPQDVNAGAGGKYIYLGYKRGATAPVTALTFVAYDQAQANPPEGWHWNHTDLNQGAGGKYIYMAWKNEAGKKAIQDILLIVTNVNHPAAIPGYVSIHQDLNQGAGGEYIWPYYSYAA